MGACGLLKPRVDIPSTKIELNSILLFKMFPSGNRSANFTTNSESDENFAQVSERLDDSHESGFTSVWTRLTVAGSESCAISLTLLSTRGIPELSGILNTEQ